MHLKSLNVLKTGEKVTPLHSPYWLKDVDPNPFKIGEWPHVLPVVIKDGFDVVQWAPNRQRACALHKHIGTTPTHVKALHRLHDVRATDPLLRLCVAPNDLTRLRCCAEDLHHSGTETRLQPNRGLAPNLLLLLCFVGVACRAQEDGVFGEVGATFRYRLSMVLLEHLHEVAAVITPTVLQF